MGVRDTLKSVCRKKDASMAEASSTASHATLEHEGRGSIGMPMPMRTWWKQGEATA